LFKLKAIEFKIKNQLKSQKKAEMSKLKWQMAIRQLADSSEPVLNLIQE